MKIFRNSVMFLLFLGALSAQTSPQEDIWGPVRPLVGSWEGDVNGQPGSGTSVREYRSVMNDRYLEVRNKSTYPAQAKNPKGEVHEDWGMISFDRARKTFVLRQFHVEGFVNQYVAKLGPEGVITFTSESIDNIAPGFRARETYKFASSNAFVERFEIAESGKDFELYDETHFRRKN